MILSGNDKLYHIAACALITMATFLALSVARRFQEQSRGCSMVDDSPSDAIENGRDVEAPGNHVAVTDVEEKCSFRISKNNWVLVGMSSLVALSIGILKEIGDMYNFWWLCQSKNEDGSIVGCDASWGDLLADIIGIILAQAIIFLFLSLWTSFARGSTRMALNYYPMARIASIES
eukprot:CCRYP_018606-RA/>CCRYP_018606-RA protein AED:0.32 eAED:0.32 QI:0/-1/0/1/-1/1/1/0/175